MAGPRHTRKSTCDSDTPDTTTNSVLPTGRLSDHAVGGDRRRTSCVFRTVFFGEASRRKQSVIHEVLTRSALTDIAARAWSAAWARCAASVTSPKREKEMCLAQVPVGFSVLTQVASPVSTGR